MKAEKDYNLPGQLSIEDVFGPDIWCGKTYPEHSVPIKEKTSERSLKKRQKWQKGMPAYLDLRGGRWPSAGCIMGDGWSIAWRVHDAQFWGVPQRRKRIALVADFGGNTAPEILFEREGLSGNTTASGKEGEGTTADAERGIGETGGGKGILIQDEHVCAFEPGAASRVGGHVYGDDVAGTVRANAGDNQQAIVYGISAYESNAMKSGNPNSGIYQAETARTLDLNGGSPACNQGGMAVVQGVDTYNGTVTGDVACTVTSQTGGSATHSGPSVVCLEGNGSRPSHQGDGYRESETMYTLNTIEQHAVCVENRPQDSRLKIKEDGIVQTLDARMGEGGGNVPLVMEQQTFSDTAAARLAQDGRGGVHTQMMADPESNFILEPYTSSKASYHQHFTNDGKAETLVASDYKDPPTVTYGLDRAAYNQGMNAQFDFAVDAEKIGTQVAKGPGAVCNNYVVRRLTPMECERLQGYDDHWTDIGDWVDSKGKPHKGDSDSPRYKALGNSIALPFWQWMAERMCRYLPEFPTMASLFDGIGGFPLSFSRAGCKPVWASEIEEFPIAVTKVRFPDV